MERARHEPRSPLLLVSVSCPEEAALGLVNGADILDIKDPREGSLGACSPASLRAIVALRNTRGVRPRLSAALGDAPNLPNTLALAAAGAAACGVDDLKVGLMGVRYEEEAVALLRAVVVAALEVSPAKRVIAAAYADAEAIGSLPAGLLPRVAERAGAQGCLVDTGRKDGRSLFDHLAPGVVQEFLTECRRLGLMCGLAGCLTRSHVPLLRELGPDFVGVRGALCSGGRRGRLDPARLTAFRDELRGAA
jgi:hypothetical protein